MLPSFCFRSFELSSAHDKVSKSNPSTPWKKCLLSARFAACFFTTSQQVWLEQIMQRTRFSIAYSTLQNHVRLTQFFAGVMIIFTSLLERAIIVTTKYHVVLILDIHEESATTGMVFRTTSMAYFVTLTVLRISLKVQFITDLMTSHVKLMQNIPRKLSHFGKEYPITLTM